MIRLPKIYVALLFLLSLSHVSHARMVHDFDCTFCHLEYSAEEQPYMTFNVCLDCHFPGNEGTTYPRSDDTDSNPITATFSAGDGSNTMGSNTAPGDETSHFFAGSSDSQSAAGAAQPSNFRFNLGWSNGQVTCSRCHNPHGETSNPKLLKLGAGSTEAMCLDCHSSWDQTDNHGLESHPLHADYPALAAANPDKFRAVPDNFGTNGGISLIDDSKASCSSCHGVHFVDSDETTPDGADSTLNDGDGKLLKFAGPSRENPGQSLCQTCHLYTEHGADSGLGCMVCHGGHEYDAGGAPNYYMLKKQVTLETVPKTGAPGTVALDYTTYPAPANLGGICQACHSLPSGHDTASSCKGCHAHNIGFTHGADSNGTGCVPCHGHDAGTLYDADMQAPYAAGATASQGTGTVQSHSTHTESTGADAKGPGIYCDSCHDITDFPYFKSGIDSNSDGRYNLSETDVCDTCHSAGGSYDGIDDAVIGAKKIWATGAYTTTESGTLIAGKEKWCATCHDEAPSGISGVSAPNVIGIESQNTNYGIGWGYYKTGHGLANGLYPASEAPAANIECSSCHDYTAGHIDGNARTYRKANDNYQASYRLVDVDGGPPMDIPDSDWNVRASDYALCFTCHESDIYLNETNYTTNFRSDVNVFNGHTPVNSHWYHLLGNGSHSNRWDSDWDRAWADSYMSCPSCHNVHGSPSPRMVRHGELISTPGTTDMVPSLDFQYLPNTYPTLAESTGGTPRFIGGGPGTIARNGICNMCHVESFAYERSPNDLYAPEIIAVFGEVGNSQLTVTFSEGVYTDPGSSGDLVAGDFSLTDTDNSRTIAGVSHTAGGDVAVLTLSSALDAVDDVDTDTLAAAASSIYDASDHAMETTPVTITGDDDAPAITNLNPSNGASEVALNENLTFTLADNGIGIDWTSFSIQLSGDLGYSKTYTDTDTTVVSRKGSPAAYKVIVNPDAFYGSGEIITVTVNVDDLAGNTLTSPAWSFTATSAAPWETPDAVHGSSLLGSPGNLIDDDLITGNSTAGGNPHSATYALDDGGDLYSITDVRLYGGSTYTASWKVYTSLDGSAFALVGSWTVGGANQWYEYTFPAMDTARYLKIEYFGVTIPENLAYELQFKGAPIVE